MNTGYAGNLFNRLAGEISKGLGHYHIECRFDIGSLAIDPKTKLPVIDPKTQKPRRAPATGNAKVTIVKDEVQGIVPTAKFSTVEEAISIAIPKALARLLFVLTAPDIKTAAKGGATPDHMLKRCEKLVAANVTPELKDALRVLIQDAESKAGNTVSYVVTGSTLSAKGFKFAVNMTDSDKVADFRTIREALTDAGYEVFTLEDFKKYAKLDPISRAEEIAKDKAVEEFLANRAEFEEFKRQQSTRPKQAEAEKVASA